MKENNRQDNTSSKAIANQQLQKKSNALSLEPPGSLSADTALAPPVQMTMEEASARYVAKRRAENEAAAAAKKQTRVNRLEAIRSEDGGKKVMEDEEKADAKKEGEGGETEERLKGGAENAAATFEFGSGMNEGIEDINQKIDPGSLTSENMEWDENTKRTDEQQEAWATEHGHSKEEVAKMKKDNAETSAVTDSVGLALSFFNLPGIYKKIKLADSYGKFEAIAEAASVGANIAKTGSSIAGAVSGGTNAAADDSASISKYTGGIIDLVKKGYTHFKSFKEEYENYQLIKNNSDGDESLTDGAKLVMMASLDTAKGILESIKAYQSSFTAFQNPAVAAAIPGLGIAISAISLFERIYTLYTSGKLEVSSKAEKQQTDTILSQLPEGENKTKVKGVLNLPEFRAFVTEIAAAYQQKRDNPEIFTQFMTAQNDPDTKKQLKKRYPSNYTKIERIMNMNKFKAGDLVSNRFNVVISNSIMDKIMLDQTIIDHMAEIKGKRETNAKIGIFTDLVNIGADIATLTGVGAAAGVGMKLGTSAIAASRSGGNAIKFGARDEGASDFAGGAAGKWNHFGSSAMDKTDILKNRAAKKERYFNTSKQILNDVIEHEINRTNAPNTPEAKAKVASSKEWVETKIMATGASLTLAKAKLNADEPEIGTIKYLMDSLRKR